jgi:hypothetical protein
VRCEVWDSWGAERSKPQTGWTAVPVHTRACHQLEGGVAVVLASCAAVDVLPQRGASR